MADIVTLAAPVPPAVLISVLLDLSGIVLLIALVLLAFICLRRWMRSPYLIIGQRRVRLLRAMQLDKSLWPDMTDETLANSRARIELYGDNRWVITVVPLGYMYIDGIRSHRNLLRNGAQVILGQSKKALFTFVDPQHNSKPIASKEM